MVVPALFFLFPGTFCGKRFAGPYCSPRGPLGCAHAKARESYSYAAPKSSGTWGSHRWRIVRNDSCLVGRIGMPAHDDQQSKKAEHVSEAHVPPKVEPASHRLRFRKH